MELRPSPGLEDRSYRASTRPSQPYRQANANSRVRLDLDRARLDLDREVSQNGPFDANRVFQTSSRWTNPHVRLSLGLLSFRFL
ncbi:hypothetical protein DY000_02040912 [Brassica cretica]|uniref:Uncharacterized protein n=1 Tax=Brassica cretica TaxID=69181 RepID=A0ABQ7BM78_BRACR|nr:hypothetical protein DY000_02040912 [Brassica cretica]